VRYNLHVGRIAILIDMCKARTPRDLAWIVIYPLYKQAVRFCAASLLRKELLICTLALVAMAQVLPAQQDGSATDGPGWPLHSSAPAHATADAMGSSRPPPIMENDESCLIWAVSDPHPSTVNTDTLQVPEKARGEFRKGCGDLRSKKLSTAESHLRKAVQEYPKYAAAWVLLGQVLESGNRIEEARGACSQASAVGSGYVPAYLCLADVAVQVHDWKETLDLADRALAIASVQNVYGNYYSAMAHFHLSHLPAAEHNAQEAIDADHSHRVPQAHLLLAQIYGAKHDLRNEAAQLRAYLKIAPDSPYSAGVRKSLADLESQIEK
jgi:tetratricopeptide (TPR) repeat protein